MLLRTVRKTDRESGAARRQRSSAVGARERSEASSLRGSERDADAASAWGFRVVESLVRVLE